MTSDTATPWGKTEMLFKNPSKCIVDSGEFLSTVSVLKQFKMENYSMPTVTTADMFLWEQKEKMRVKKIKTGGSGQEMIRANSTWIDWLLKG